MLNLIAPPRRFELQETHFREFAHLLNECKSVMSLSPAVLGAFEPLDALEIHPGSDTQNQNII